MLYIKFFPKRGNMKYLIVILFSLSISEIFAESHVLDANELKKEKLYSSLEEALRDPQKVYRLNLSNSKLSEIPKEIEKLKNLQELGVTTNKIEFVPDEVCKLTKL